MTKSPAFSRVRNVIGGLVATFTVLIGAATAAEQKSRTEPPGVCSPSQDLKFVCGAEKPEDLAHIPGTRWLVVSGFRDGAGLKLVDSSAAILRTWYTGTPEQIRFDDRFRSTCPAPPDPKTLNVQGLSLRTSADRVHTLYATNHGGRESVEIFRVDARRDEPALLWVGCVLLPPSVAANSVASFSDGTILITELIRAGTTIADFVNGNNTGAVYAWKPNSTSFLRLIGTELPGNNGLETAQDDSEFYVVAFGLHAVVVFSRADTSKPVRMAVAPGFMPDNIHWDRGRLITGGMQTDEPACGGLRKVVDGKADGMLCHRGYVIAELAPQSMTYKILAYSGPDPQFNGASGAVIIGNELWISSYQAQCVAHRTLTWLESTGD